MGHQVMETSESPALGVLAIIKGHSTLGPLGEPSRNQPSKDQWIPNTTLGLQVYLSSFKLKVRPVGVLRIRAPLCGVYVRTPDFGNSHRTNTCFGPLNYINGTYFGLFGSQGLSTYHIPSPRSNMAIYLPCVAPSTKAKHHIQTIGLQYGP